MQLRKVNKKCLSVFAGRKREIFEFRRRLGRDTSECGTFIGQRSRAAGIRVHLRESDSKTVQLPETQRRGRPERRSTEDPQHGSPVGDSAEPRPEESADLRGAACYANAPNDAGNVIQHPWQLIFCR